MSIGMKLGLTGVLVIGYGFLSTISNKIQTLVSGEAAPHQFDNSDTSYVVSSTTMHYMNGHTGMLTVALLIALVVVWWTSITSVITLVMKGDNDHA